ncbi:MAG: hypothetical protein KKH68_01210 [Proteobacteria bacterium]|nr:hypothetical protein [Pseudomonadota bacterium]
MGKKIVCIYCGQRADVVHQDDSDLVICKNCRRETAFGVYREMVDYWLDEVHEKGIFKDRRSGKDRRLSENNILAGTDRRRHLDRRY